MRNKKQRGLRQNNQHAKINKSKRLAILLVGIVTVLLAAFVWTQREKIIDTVGPKIGLVNHKKSLKQSWQKTLSKQSINVDIAVYDNKKKELITLRHSNTDKFVTASAIKVSVLGELLLEHENSQTDLTDDEKELANSMITASDNDATTSLLYQMGGYQAPDNLFEKLGMNDSQMNAGAWGYSTTTASDQIKLLRNIFYKSNVLSADSQQYARSLMSQVNDDQAWGVSAGVPKNAQISLKNGWLPDDDDGWMVNSLGHIKTQKADYVIAVLTNGDVSEQSGIDLIEKLSRQTYRELIK
ncbi:serine hydrolase [Weissella bombi]|uniref:Beta-lactamase class A n=1 Tax=Weissella bombi TaxID=1505725 RepID=A0A1C4A9A6_9LACO|nr:serine hydrolase [Weissella bombi]SCB91229.1 Beta-lactamase class A [Weissella bombi]